MDKRSSTLPADLARCGNRPKAAPATPRLITVTQWPQLHPWPSVAGLRWLIFNASRNGFDSVVKRVGRRVLIDEAAFFAWVDAQDEGGSSSGSSVG